MAISEEVVVDHESQDVKKVVKLLDRYPVEVSVEGFQLVNMDHFSKSDPFVVFFLRESSGDWKKVGETETLWDDLNPRFVEKLVRKFPGKNGLTKMMRFDVYDRDTVKDVDLSKHDFIGSAQCCLYDILTSEKSLKLKLRNDQLRKDPGSIIVSAEIRRPLEPARTTEFKISFGPVNQYRGATVFYEISRLLTDNRWTLVYRSDRTSLRERSKFDLCHIDEEDLTAGHDFKLLRLDVYRVRKLHFGQVQLLDSFVFNLEDLCVSLPGCKVIKACTTELEDGREECSDRQVSLFDMNISDNYDCSFHLRMQNF